MTRHITHRQEQIYRMRHHDFAGLTTKQVAAMLGITVQCVTMCMRRMKKIAPQLFPIFTRLQAEIYSLFVCAGLEQKVIGKMLGISEKSVSTMLRRLRNNGIDVPLRQRKERVRYAEWMSSKIVHKF
ncbi:hypothetical protein KAR91_78645 [Candidatus Pacearchaeota archaeon]|nr:hypothetical protein [Candidatus Pacearchaeota archaeon]